jgi:uncharacterized PurR-regulated membrane protein YhhQ (DUF165 family)
MTQVGLFIELVIVLVIVLAMFLNHLRPGKNSVEKFLKSLGTALLATVGANLLLFVLVGILGKIIFNF